MGKLVSDVGTDDPVFEERSLTIDPDPEHLGEARQWAYRAAAKAGLGESDCYQVKLAVSEAVTNAIEHGSPTRGDPIQLTASEHDGSLIFEVRDRGTFVAPLSSATLDDESGRGLELLTLVMDEVHISSSGAGSTLRFAKRLA
jgi:anti-sigma regulatory factor (Ser/Thr protein kinase)